MHPQPTIGGESMGVYHGGQVPQEFRMGSLMQIVPPPDFVTQVQKGAFSGLQNTPKSVFGRGSAARTLLGELTTLPQTLQSAGEGQPSPYPTPNTTALGTDPPSALAMRPPESQSDLCYGREALCSAVIRPSVGPSVRPSVVH